MGFEESIKTINARNTKILLLKKNEAIKNIRTIPNGDKKKGKILCKYIKNISYLN